MAKEPIKPSFGTTVQEVDNNIAAMNLEREELAKKQGTKYFDNKRFEQLSNDLTTANKQRSSMQPQEGGTPNDQKFNQVVTTVPAKETGLSPTTATTFNAPAANPLDQPQSGNLLGSATPGQEVLGGTSLTGFDNGSFAPQNDISLLNTGEVPVASTGDIPIPQTNDQGILQNFLGSIDRTQGNGIGNQINTAMFQKPGAYKSDPKVDIEAGDLFFGANNPILKGNVSGSFMGSQPIFAPGGNLFPAQVLNRRQKAIQDAAIAKKEQEKAFLSQRPPQIKDKGFQQSLNKMHETQFNGYVDRAKEEYGEGWYDAITDQSTPIGREYVSFLNNMDFIAGSADQSADLINKTRTSIDKGELVYSDATMQKIDDYENLQGEFAGGDVNSSVNLRQEWGKVQGAMSLDEFLKVKSVDIKPTVTAWASAADTNEAYVTYEGKKTAYEAQLKQLANDWATKPSELSPLVRSGMITEEDIFNHLQSLYGYDAVSEASRSTSNKPDNGGGFTINIEGSGETTDKETLVNGQNYEVLYSRENTTAGKPMEMSGMNSYDQNGNLVKESGVVNIDHNGYHVINVPIKDVNGNVTYEKRKAVIGTSTTPPVYYTGTTMVKTPGSTVTKYYEYNDQVKKKLMTEYPDAKDQIETMSSEMDAVVAGEEVEVDMSGGAPPR